MGAVPADAPGRQSEDHRLGSIGVRCGNVRQPVESVAGFMSVSLVAERSGRMTAVQIAEAQRLTREWTQKGLRRAGRPR